MHVDDQGATDIPVRAEDEDYHAAARQMVTDLDGDAVADVATESSSDGRITASERGP